MVSRTEANDIPHLLVAPKDEDSENSSDIEVDTRGFYDDGAYVAAPMLGPEPPSSRHTDSIYPDSNQPNLIPATPQDAFTKRLLTLFHAQRSSIGQLVESNQASDQNSSNQLGYSSFKRLVHTSSPTPRQLSLLSQQNVLKALHVSPALLKRYRAIHPQFSAWLFGLLCRLNGSGTLDSDAVSIVRELGKKAVYVGIGYFNKSLAHEDVEGYFGDSAEESVASDDELSSRVEDPGPIRKRNSSSPIAPAMNDVMEVETMEISKSSNDQDIRVSTEAFVATKDEDVSEEFEESENSRLKPRARKRNTSSPLPPEISSDKVDVNDTAALNAARERILSTLSDRRTATKKPSKPVKSPIQPVTDDRSAFSKTKCTVADVNTRATLDVLITIIGEVYGQRDLLEFRTVWPGENGLWG